ncbi:MAG: hypothetical protein DMD91_05375 [Candidatus Rokuibacteriota bacterium]|nr:MAG: hypothetical protein DMD91_05375 [Candidatus Rokubacteria bacterium]
MRSWTAGIIVLAGAAGLLTGCATPQEWSDWKSHPTHFASGEHFAFSVRTGDAAKQIRRSDIEVARAQNWWGKPITVDQSQVLEN